MAGVKRRTKYRKNVAQELEDHAAELEDGDLIARVLGSRGGNLFDVESQDGVIALCRLPTRFRKMVWIKRGSYIVVVQAADDVEVGNSKGKAKVLFACKAILMEHQIKEFRQQGQWPQRFMTVEEAAAAEAQAAAAKVVTSSAAASGVAATAAADEPVGEAADGASGDAAPQALPVAVCTDADTTGGVDAASSAAAAVGGPEAAAVAATSMAAVESSPALTAAERQARLLERYQYEEESSEDMDDVVQNRNRTFVDSDDDSDSGDSD